MSAAPNLLLELPDPGDYRIDEGHAIDLLANVPELDLLITDPPYALGGEGAEHAVTMSSPRRQSPTAELDYIVEPPAKVGRRAALPERVANWSVAPFAVPGGLALDPFAGSGALPRAAAAAGMAALGFEVNPW